MGAIASGSALLAPVPLPGVRQPSPVRARGRTGGRAGSELEAAASSAAHGLRVARDRGLRHDAISARCGALLGGSRTRLADLKYSRHVELELPTGDGPDRDIPLGGSPFPPIADYALLSDCEVCALVAPDGNVEWLSLPQMDGPSVFSAILDRHAGRFRAGPVDRTVPAGRRYLPGTMILETTWGTPTGWLEVRDVLLIGPWHEDEALGPVRPRPARPRGRARPAPDPSLPRRLRRPRDRLPARDSTTGAGKGRWRHVGDGLRRRRLRGRGDRAVAAAAHRSAPRVRGRRERMRETRMRAGQQAFCALGWSEYAPPATYDEAEAETRGDASLLARVDRPRSLSGSSLADPPAAVRAHAQGADLRSDRSDDRRGDDLAARDARRRAQLGLPLQLAAGLDVHALGTLDPRLRPRGERLLLLHRRPGRGRRPADHVRHRRARAARRGDARSPHRLRRRAAGAGRQRRLAPQAARCLGRAPRLGPAPHALGRSPGRPPLDGPRAPGRRGARALA